MASCTHVCGKCEKSFFSVAQFHDHYTVNHPPPAQAGCGEKCFSTMVHFHDHYTVADKKLTNRVTLDGHTNALSMSAHSCNICANFCSKWVDLNVRGDGLQRHSEAELDKNSKCVELSHTGADTHSDSPKLNGTISRTTSVTHATTPVIPKLVTTSRPFLFHLNANEVVDSSQPETLMQHPKANTVTPTPLLTVNDALSAKEQNLQTQEESFPEYPYLLSSSDDSYTDEKQFVCGVCGKKFRDMNSFVLAHLPCKYCF